MRPMGSALAILALLAAGCAAPGIPQDSGAGTPPPASTPLPATNAPGGKALTLEQLKNIAYPLPEANGNFIKFTDGKYRGAVVLGSLEEQRYLILDRIGRGDLDGDGVDDAAVIMIKDPAGDNPVYTLWAVINQSGVADPRGNVVLGEKIQVGGLSVEGLKVFVEVVRPGPQDIQGIPTQRIKESYKLFGSQLQRADLFR